MAKPGRDLLAGFLAALGALALFGWLAERVWLQRTMAFDASVRAALHSFASPALTDAFRVISFLGSEVFLVPFGAALVWRLWRIGRTRAAWLYVVAAAGGELLLGALKLIFHRPRPPVFFGLTEPTSYSFPSGHSMLSACFYGVAAAILTARMEGRARRFCLWAGAAAAALLIGISRIYLGVHYPSDVLGGYAAAVIWVVAVRLEYARRVIRQRRRSDVPHAPRFVR